MYDKKSEASIALPIVVVQRFESTSDDWVLNDRFLNDNYKEQIFVSNRRTRMMKDFLNRNLYTVVWEDAHWKILKPGKTLSKDQSYNSGSIKGVEY